MVALLTYVTQNNFICIPAFGRLAYNTEIIRLRQFQLGEVFVERPVGRAVLKLHQATLIFTVNLQGDFTLNCIQSQLFTTRPISPQLPTNKDTIIL